MDDRTLLPVPLNQPWRRLLGMGGLFSVLDPSHSHFFLFSHSFICFPPCLGRKLGREEGGFACTACSFALRCKQWAGQLAAGSWHQKLSSHAFHATFPTYFAFFISSASPHFYATTYHHHPKAAASLSLSSSLSLYSQFGWIDCGGWWVDRMMTNACMVGLGGFWMEQACSVIFLLICSSLVEFLPLHAASCTHLEEQTCTCGRHVSPSPHAYKSRRQSTAFSSFLLPPLEWRNFHR